MPQDFFLCIYRKEKVYRTVSNYIAVLQNSLTCTQIVCHVMMSIQIELQNAMLCKANNGYGQLRNYNNVAKSKKYKLNVIFKYASIQYSLKYAKSIFAFSLDLISLGGKFVIYFIVVELF